MAVHPWSYMHARFTNSPITHVLDHFSSSSSSKCKPQPCLLQLGGSLFYFGSLSSRCCLRLRWKSLLPRFTLFPGFGFPIFFPCCSSPSATVCGISVLHLTTRYLSAAPSIRRCNKSVGLSKCQPKAGPVSVNRGSTKRECSQEVNSSMGHHLLLSSSSSNLQIKSGFLYSVSGRQKRQFIYQINCEMRSSVMKQYNL